jgi:CRP/FNR family transcriptional regulator
MNKIIETNCLHCQKIAGAFRNLEAVELDRVNCNKVSIAYNPGEIIFKQGTPCHHFVCVTSGLVKLYIEHKGSDNLIVGFTRPVNYIFEPGVFVDTRHHFTAVACEPVTACLVDSGIMKELIRENPTFAGEFISHISVQAIELFTKISSFTRKHVYGRIADVILSLSEDIYQANPFTMTLSRQDIADMAGMTKESAIRVLKRFKDEGIITLEGNILEILDIEKLKNVSEKG